jgi:hypothetical protein
VSLQLDKSTASPGEEVRARIVDGTSRPFSTGLVPRVRRFEEGKPTRLAVTENGVPVSYSNVELGYSPHSISECTGFQVSADWQPGSYQVLVEASVGYPARAQKRWLAARFEVR